MKEPTYSVFVRFRRGQRLTLKRSAPLDVALRFAMTVRSERFHRPEDVFVIDDATGEAVSELATPEQVSASALIEAAPAAVFMDREASPRDEVQAPISFSEGWQFHHAQVTVRGGHRLTAAVERSLAQLNRLAELLRCSNILLGEAEEVSTEATRALEHIRHAQEALRRAETKLGAAPSAADVAASLKALAVASLGESRAQTRKRPVRAKV
jgi:hypothetical protein